MTPSRNGLNSDDENPHLMNEHARRNVVSTLFVLVVTGVCETKLFVVR
jgi:hypothetical protein